MHIVLYKYTWQVENAHSFSVHYVRKHYHILLTADSSIHSFVQLIKVVNLLDHNHRVKKLKKAPTVLTLMILLVAMVIKYVLEQFNNDASLSSQSSSDESNDLSGTLSHK